MCIRDRRCTARVAASWTFASWASSCNGEGDGAVVVAGADGDCALVADDVLDIASGVGC